MKLVLFSFLAVSALNALLGALATSPGAELARYSDQTVQVEGTLSAPEAVRRWLEETPDPDLVSAGRQR
jgi:hypothetical protein